MVSKKQTVYLLPHSLGLQSMLKCSLFSSLSLSCL